MTVLPALCRAWRASAGRGKITGWRTSIPRPVPATAAAAPPSQIRPISTPPGGLPVRRRRRGPRGGGGGAGTPPPGIY